MSKKIMQYFWIAIFMGIGFISFACSTSHAQQILINSEQIVPFTEGWSYSVNGVPAEGTIDLPAKVEAKGSDSVVITHTLPQTYREGMTLCFRSVQQFVRVFVNGKELYEYGYSSTRLFGKTPGSAWNFIRLGKETAGGEVSIELISPYNDYQNINEINYGSKNANVFYIISNNLWALFISIVIVIIGIVLMILYFFFKKQERSNALLYLGWFSVLAGLWSLSESRMLQFIFSNQFAVLLFAFSTLQLLGIPLLLFIVETHSVHSKKPFFIMCWLFLANFVVSMGLQLFNVMDYLEFSYITHALIVCGVVLILGTILVEVLHYKNKEMYVLGIGSAILVMVSMLDFFQFYKKMTGDNAFFFRIGVLFYILILSYYIIKQLLSMLGQSMKADMYEQLAYMDLLTNLQNRTAFEKCMEEYRTHVEACENLSLGIFDINNLKWMNDTFGHKAGDENIIASAAHLRETFHEIGDLYRIGGDEFALVAKGVSETEMKAHLQELDERLENHNKKTDIALHLAYGTAQFSIVTDGSADGLYRRADGYMYEKKNWIKSNQGRRKGDPS